MFSTYCSQQFGHLLALVGKILGSNCHVVKGAQHACSRRVIEAVLEKAPDLLHKIDGSQARAPHD
jgi:hypothetical protein